MSMLLCVQFIIILIVNQFKIQFYDIERHNSCYLIVIFNDEQQQQQQQFNKINYNPLAFAIKDNKSDLLMGDEDP